jgi:hypothetical protein
MPNIRTYETQTDIPLNAPTGREANAGDFGGYSAYALHNLGGSFGEISAEMERRRKEEEEKLRLKQEEDAVLWANKSLAELHSTQNQYYLESQKDYPYGDGFTNNFKQQFNTAAEKLVESAPTEHSRKELEIALIKMEDSFSSNAIVYEADAKSKKLSNDVSKAQNIYLNQTRADPSKYLSSLEFMGNYINSLPVNDAVKGAMYKDFSDDLSINQAEGMISNANSIQSAKDVFSALQDEDFKKRIPASEYGKLLGIAENNINYQKQEAARLEAERDKIFTAQMNNEYVDLALAVDRGEKGQADIDLFKKKYGNLNEALARWLQLSEKSDANINTIQSNKQTSEYVDLALAIGRGEKGQPAADDFRKKYGETGDVLSKWLALSESSDAVIKQYAKEIMPILVVNQAFQYGIPLDPNDADIKKAVDKHYQNMVQTWKPEEQVEKAIYYVNRIGVIPQSMISEISANINSSNPDNVLPAAEIIEQLSSQNPQLAQQIPQNQLSFAKQVLDYTRYGDKPKDAVERAVQSRRVSDAERKSRGAAFEKIIKDAPLEKYLDNKIDEGWMESPFLRSNPDVLGPMVEEMKILAMEDYIQHGDINTALSVGFNAVRSTWGATNIGGRHFMKYAPELFYGIPSLSLNENSKWIKEQLFSDINKDAFGGEIKNINDRIIIEQDPRHMSADGRPLYFIGLHGEDGAIFMQPKPWMPDFYQSPEKKEIDFEMEKSKAHAKSMREGADITPAPPEFMWGP